MHVAVAAAAVALALAADPTASAICTALALASAGAAALAAAAIGHLGDHLLQLRGVSSVCRPLCCLEPQLLRWHHAQRRRPIQLERAIGGGARRNVYPGNDYLVGGAGGLLGGGK